MSFTKTQMFRPLNNKPLTVAEMLTVFAVCTMLHSLTLPAVTSQPHPRRIAPAPAFPVVTQPSGDVIQSDSDILDIDNSDATRRNTGKNGELDDAREWPIRSESDG